MEPPQVKCNKFYRLVFTSKRAPWHLRARGHLPAGPYVNLALSSNPIKNYFSEFQVMLEQEQEEDKEKEKEIKRIKELELR